METIILASGSPRRRDLLARVKVPCKIISPEIIIMDFTKSAYLFSCV